MEFTNARLFLNNGFAQGSFRVCGDVFGEIRPGVFAKDGIDLHGATVIPGLVDMHTHGNSGADFSDGSADGLRTMAEYLVRHGVTSFAPTSMTLPEKVLSAAFSTAKELSENRPENCARILGIHMEGPFLSAKRNGSQNAAYLRSPDYPLFERLYDRCGGLIRIVDVAPELEKAAAFAQKASRLCTVSAAHTNATYSEAQAFFEAGASHVTHLFNAMPPLLHREPGVIGAAGERSGVTAELICDGLHVHESAVRAAFRLFPGRICLISDALRCCGMPDGAYELSGQTVYLSGGIARLADGTIAGSAVNLFDCLRNAIRFGIPETDAVRAATILPARKLGAEKDVGSIESGKKADFVICDREYRIFSVYTGGKKII